MLKLERGYTYSPLIMLSLILFVKKKSGKLRLSLPQLHYAEGYQYLKTVTFRFGTPPGIPVGRGHVIYQCRLGEGRRI